MKIQCDAKVLLAACQVVQPAVARKTTKPILTKVKFTADDTGLTLWATDLESGIRHSVDGVAVEKEGEAVIDADKLMKIIKESGAATIAIDAGERAVKVVAGFSDFELPVENVAEFPPCPEPDTVPTVMDGGELASLIRRAAFAVGQDNTKYAITALLFDVADDGKLCVVGTDTRRLAVVESGQPFAGPKGSYLVPADAAAKVQRLAADGGEVGVWLKPNQAFFRVGNSLLYTRLMEGRYPPYRSIMPKKSNMKVTMGVGEFNSLLRQSLIMVDRETTRAAFEFAANELTVTSQEATKGKGNVRMPLADHTANGFTVDMDPAYVASVMRVLDDDSSVDMHAVDNKKPVLFKQANGFECIVMPQM